MTEAACLGAALLAGVASGVYPDVETAVSRTVHLGRQIAPDERSAAAYEGRFKIYTQLYPTLRHLHERL